ncbi:hypothetical protein [Hahella sp. NBU794]|uniref:hypothetical protein n=1 Tax=Hahella sp. NBU794 TaxID=3422590 RepID=UPI003D6F2611
MLYTNEMFNILKTLRRRFKEENLGTLRLTDPDVLQNVIEFAKLSDVSTTKDMAHTLLKMTGTSVSRVELEGRDNHPAAHLPANFHGESIRGRIEASQEAHLKVLPGRATA